MSDFYVPRSGKIVVAGQTFRLHKGIHPVPDVVANSHEANAYGIKPVEEMVDDEWKMLALNKDAYFEARKAAEAKSVVAAPVVAPAVTSPPAGK